MSNLLSSTPRRGHRALHLRQFSNGDASDSRPMSATSDAETVQHDPLPLKTAVERKCILWVHDEAFSKEEVILNLDLFPDIKAKELMTIMPLKTDSGLRDFPDKASSKRESDVFSNPIQRERSNSQPRSPSLINQSNPRPDVDLKHRYVFLAQGMSNETRSKQPNLEVSVAKHVADVFGLKHRSNVLVTSIDPAISSASHVELTFKDEYLARSDMWRLCLSELVNKTVYVGQKVVFLGSIKAQITAVYMVGRKVQSAFFSTETKPVFRSGSARYILFIQMSREMWDFDSEGSGEIMFNKVVNGFLPALFKKWETLQVKHLVSIVLFTRVEYDTGITSELATDTHDTAYHTGIQSDDNKKPYKDFFRVVVSEMRSGEWTKILYQLKREFKFFRRDISMHRIDIITTSGAAVPLSANMRGALGTRIEAEPSLAMHGNVLEAINLAASQFAFDYIDRDLIRTGISIVVITPCPGLFEVDYETLRTTTETLIGNGIGIDLVCLPKMPLHSVPLFRYRNPQYASFQEALQLRSFRSQDSTPRQHTGVFSSSFSSLSESLSPTKSLQTEYTSRMTGSFAATKPPEEWCYAIPHWLDVSFWTGASQNGSLASIVPEAEGKSLRRTRSDRKNVFAVRCKMYEMEMASVMENAMSEIMIMPLQHDSLFPQIANAVREAVKQPPLEPLNAVRRTKGYMGLSEFVSGPSKFVSEKNIPQLDKRVFQALDKFDLMKSEISESSKEIRLKDDIKGYTKSSSDEASRKPLAEDSKVFSTSFKDDAAIHKETGFFPKSISGKSKQEGIDVEKPSARLRKDSIITSMPPKSRPSPTKTPKLGRQISLGKYGFGIAAPKAAIAEIQTENASAAKPVSTAFRATDSKTTTGSMTNHFLQTTTSQALERPSSSQSDMLSMKSSAMIGESRSYVDSWDIEKSLSTRPMTVKSALQSMDSKNQVRSRSVLGSLYETPELQRDGEVKNPLASSRIDDNQRLFNTKLLAGSVPELPATLSPTTALSPWLSVLNPSNPSAGDIMGPSQYRRWQHVFPKPLLTKTMKWKSLCSPAAVPLTTEFFPTKHQLDTEYQQKPYNISQNTDEDLNEKPRTREEFLRELIGLRLSQGFQVVVGPAVAEAFGQKSLKIASVFNCDGIVEGGASVFLSMGNIIHQLSCVNDTEVEINTFVRKPTAAILPSPGLTGPSLYNPAIRTTLATQYESRQIVLGKPKDEYNWNYVDTFVAGFDEEMTDHLRFWRARFVLIPVERPSQSQRRHGEDNEEEIRLEGIKKLTQLWQRHRVLTASEKRFQSTASRKTKDLNPLDIVYKTEDPSIVVTAELETLPLVETVEPSIRKGQLLETERFRKSKLDIAALAEAMQAPAEKGGVRMQNRRWHFRLHYNCFIGSDMTTWLIENFEDIETRDEAVELGNRLMAKDEMKPGGRDMIKDSGKEKEKDMGIFVHVEKRHPFRDGQFFYQITGEYGKQRPDTRSGWFAPKRRDTSVPSTPLSDNIMKDSPKIEQSGSSSIYGEKSSDGTATPTTSGGGKRPKVALSKVMKYDVDHRKRSYRLERINLHYDRLHNPDNCYHIRIDWINVTAKLIEDAIESWASTAERYGLRLVEAPIGEASAISSIHPFRSPYLIELAVQPPDQQPKATYFDANSFVPQTPSTPANRHYYQKAIMKKFNFVLDIEAARNFPSNVDVIYSWGKPDFKYSQYIHRSGVVLAQITDNGGFLLLANRLYNNRTMGGRDFDRYLKFGHLDRNNRGGATSPINSPILRPTGDDITSPTIRATSDVLGLENTGARFLNTITPETIKKELEAFCKNSSSLEAFYKETLEKAIVPTATPPTLKSIFINNTLDSNIPVLGLPPGLLARDSSPSPMRLSGGFPGYSSSLLGRRHSGAGIFLGDAAKDNSRNTGAD